MSYNYQQPPAYAHAPSYHQPGGYGQHPGYAPPQQQQQQQHGAYGAPQAEGYGAPSGAPAQAPPPQQPQQAGQQQEQLAMWFQSIDTDRSGQLDAQELQRALQMGSLKFGLSDVDAMVRAFDTRGERKLNLQEFSKLHAFLTSIQASFTYFDSDRTNTLAQVEVVAALRQAGFNLDPPVVTAMMARHDPDNTKTLTLDEFIRMCLFLQSCVRTFSAFDAQRQGRIVVDFGQFVYACSHIC